MVCGCKNGVCTNSGLQQMMVMVMVMMMMMMMVMMMDDTTAASLVPPAFPQAVPQLGTCWGSISRGRASPAGPT